MIYIQHPDRKEERCFLPYKPPPEENSPAQIEEFLEQAQFISEDLEWLLSLPHDKFWCQVRSQWKKMYLSYLINKLNVFTSFFVGLLMETNHYKVYRSIFYFCCQCTGLFAHEMTLYFYF